MTWQNMQKQKQQWIKIESEKNGWHVPKCFQILHIDAIHSSVMSSWFVVLLSCYNFNQQTHMFAEILSQIDYMHLLVSTFALFFVLNVRTKALNGKSMIEWNQKYQNNVLRNISWFSCHSFQYGCLRNVWSWTSSKSVYMNWMLMDRIFLHFLPKNQWILSTWFSTLN